MEQNPREAARVDPTRQIRCSTFSLQASNTHLWDVADVLQSFTIYVCVKGDLKGVGIQVFRSSHGPHICQGLVPPKSKTSVRPTKIPRRLDGTIARR